MPLLTSQPNKSYPFNHTKNQLIPANYALTRRTRLTHYQIKPRHIAEMCQQHIRSFECTHSETLKPAYCPLILTGGSCSDMITIQRSAPGLCPQCTQLRKENMEDAMDTTAG